MSIEVDERYMDVTADKQKVYMAPVSPWCESRAVRKVDLRLTRSSLYPFRKRSFILEELDLLERNAVV